MAVLDDAPVAVLPGTAARRRGRGPRRLLGLVAPLGLLAAWYVASDQGLVSVRLLPAPAMSCAR